MPEGHSIHRIARQFARNFVGRKVRASSPQGRFVAGAALLDGRLLCGASAVGKHLLLAFEGDVTLRVHLGIYGAWDFAGDILVDATIAAANGRMGQTGQRGADPSQAVLRVFDRAGENSLASIGAPRRVRHAESERSLPLVSFPPDPVGQVRLRLLTEVACADLRGPTACEIIDPPAVDRLLDTLGPDPLVTDPADGESRFVAAVSRSSKPIGLLLMDQSVVAGIGNVYRAELLFRAGCDPHRPGCSLPADVITALWQDWTHLLGIGVATGQMLTRDDLTGPDLEDALRDREYRHWVYGRAGLPCRRCATPIALELAAARKLYWCPTCQPPTHA